MEKKRERRCGQFAKGGKRSPGNSAARGIAFVRKGGDCDPRSPVQSQENEGKKDRGGPEDKGNLASSEK